MIAGLAISAIINTTAYWKSASASLLMSLSEVLSGSLSKTVCGASFAPSFLVDQILLPTSSQCCNMLVVPS